MSLGSVLMFIVIFIAGGMITLISFGSYLVSMIKFETPYFWSIFGMVVGLFLLALAVSIHVEDSQQNAADNKTEKSD